jgi:hypothetical protein
MEVGQGPNWGCSAKEKKTVFFFLRGNLTSNLDDVISRSGLIPFSCQVFQPILINVNWFDTSNLPPILTLIGTYSDIDIIINYHRNFNSLRIFKLGRLLNVMYTMYTFSN